MYCTMCVITPSESFISEVLPKGFLGWFVYFLMAQRAAEAETKIVENKYWFMLEHTGAHFWLEVSVKRGGNSSAGKL